MRRYYEANAEIIKKRSRRRYVPRPRKPKVTPEQVLDLLRRGYKRWQIATLCCISRPRVTQILNGRNGKPGVMPRPTYNAAYRAEIASALTGSIPPANHASRPRLRQRVRVSGLAVTQAKRAAPDLKPISPLALHAMPHIKPLARQPIAYLFSTLFGEFSAMKN